MVSSRDITEEELAKGWAKVNDQTIFCEQRTIQKKYTDWHDLIDSGFRWPWGLFV